MIDWQPIETAPKDGTDVLLWEGGKYGEALIATYDRHSKRWEERTREPVYSFGNPTHWAPLTHPETR